MFYYNLDCLCKSNGLTVTALLNKLKFSTSKGTAWKNGSVPNGDVLSKIADYFNCSVDYLLGRSPSQTLKNGEVSKEEKQLLEYFNALNDEGKEKALERLEEMAALDRYKKGGQSGVAKEA